jgi:DNA-binding beta-propeller fold protein YncE
MSTTTHRTRRRLTAVLAALLLAPFTGVVAPAGPAAAVQGHGRGTAAAERAVRAPADRAGSADTGFGRALVGSAPVGRGPSELAFSPRTHTMYVTNGNNVDGPNAGGDTVSVVDTRRCHSGDISRCDGPWPTIVVGNRTPDDLPSGVAVDVATDTVYVANLGANTVSVFDGATCNAVVTSGCGQVPAEVPVGAGPLAMTIDPISDTAYVANSSGTSVSLLDTKRCNAAHLSDCPTTALPAVDVAAAPFNVDTDEQSHTAYVTTVGDHNGWAVFDTRTCNARRQTGCTTLGRLAGDPAGPNDGKVDPIHHTLFTADFGNTISAFDLRHCRADDLSGCATVEPGVVTALPKTGFEHDLWVAIDTAHHTAYVSFHKDDAVLVVDTDLCNGARPAGCALAPPQEIHTGTNPEAISLDPRTHTLYTANEIDNTVSVIDASLCNARVTRGCRTRPPSAAVRGAGGIAVDHSVHTAYVTSFPNTVAMIDTRRCNAFHAGGCGQAPATATVAEGPVAIAVDTATHTAYVASFGAADTGSVSVLDTRRCNAHPSGCTVVGTLQVTAGSPTSITVNSTTGTVYVGTATSGGANGVSVFNGGTCNASTSTGCGQTAARMTAGPTLGPSAACGSYYVAVAVNEASNTVYATNTESCGGHTEKVYVYDGGRCGATDMTGCGDALATVTAGFGPYGLAVDQTTNTVYAPLLADGEFAGNVSVINGTTCNASNTSGCGHTPSLAAAGFGSIAAAVDPRTHNVYVTNIEDTSVSVIDGAHCNGTDVSNCNQMTHPKVSVDDYPSAVAVDPQIGTAYVTSGVKGTVTVVRLKPAP